MVLHGDCAVVAGGLGAAHTGRAPEDGEGGQTAGAPRHGPVRTRRRQPTQDSRSSTDDILFHP